MPTEREELLAVMHNAKLATFAFTGNDGSPSMAVRDNQEAAEIATDAALAWMRERESVETARAWDEGHRVGWEHHQDGNYGTDYWDDETPNPYRPETREGE